MSSGKINKLQKEFISGNAVGLKDLYQELRGDIVAILISKAMIDPKEAESYFSSALVLFYENVTSGKLNEVRSIKNYICGIALNLIRQEILMKSNMSKRVEEIRLLLYDREKSSRSRKYKEHLKSSCKNALVKLNAKCKRIIIAYYIDGLSMKEIAKALNLSSGDVAKTLKRRCYKQLLSHVKHVAV